MSRAVGGRIVVGQTWRRLRGRFEVRGGRRGGCERVCCSGL